MNKLVTLLFILCSFSSFAQDDFAQKIEKMIKERDKMFNSLMKSMFSDDPMEDSFFKDMSSFKEKETGLQMNWSEHENGRKLTITPKNEKSPINIDINQNRITLSGKVVEEKTDAKGAVISKSSHSFSQSVGIPEELDGSKAEVKQEGKKLVVEIPFKKVLKKKSAPQKRLRPLDPNQFKSI